MYFIKVNFYIEWDGTRLFMIYITKLWQLLSLCTVFCDLFTACYNIVFIIGFYD